MQHVDNLKASIMMCTTSVALFGQEWRNKTKVVELFGEAKISTSYLFSMLSFLEFSLIATASLNLKLSRVIHIWKDQSIYRIPYTRNVKAMDIKGFSNFSVYFWHILKICYFLFL